MGRSTMGERMPETVRGGDIPRSVSRETSVRDFENDIIEYLGLWETLHNTGFKLLEFEEFKKEAGRHTFTLSPKQWIERTHAIGITSRSGRYGGGTYAHTDIAFEFASWISPEFKLYLITDYQRLKLEERSTTSLEWRLTRELSKINYLIHTDAVRNNLVPEEVNEAHRTRLYGREADVLNVALFGCTAAEWRASHPQASGNMRDYANMYQLIVLSNLESHHAELIKRGMPQSERLVALNRMAREQLSLLLKHEAASRLLDSGNLQKEEG